MTAEAQKKEEATVLDVVKGVYEAWNNADPDAFVAEYLQDASTIPARRVHEVARGDPQRHGVLLQRAAEGTRSSDKVLDVRFLNDGAVVVISETGILVPGEAKAPPERTAYASWVLAKRDGKWLLAAYSNSPSVTPGQS